MFQAFSNWVYEKPEGQEVCVGKVLSSGAYGEVSRAMVEVDGTVQYVALKKELEKSLLDTGIVKEADIWSNLPPHPNIMKGTMVMSDDSNVFSIMPLMAGDLYRIAEDIRGNGYALMDVLFQISKGIQHMHHHGFVHSDLKMANIFYDNYGMQEGSQNTSCIKIGDFGLVFRYLPGDDLVVSNSTFGEPDSGHQWIEVDSSTDIFSLGITFLQIVGHQMNPAIWTEDSDEWERIFLDPSVAEIENGYCGEYSCLLVDLIVSMCQISPEDRLTIDEVVNHPYFDDIRPEGDYIRECGMSHNYFDCDNEDFPKAEVIGWSDSSQLISQGTINLFKDKQKQVFSAISMMITTGWQVKYIPHLIWAMALHHTLNGGDRYKWHMEYRKLLNFILHITNAGMTYDYDVKSLDKDIFFEMKGRFLPSPEYVRDRFSVMDFVSVLGFDEGDKIRRREVNRIEEYLNENGDNIIYTVFA